MKDPILLLHGWGSTMSGERYKEAVNLLENSGFVVFCPDMPGFGTSNFKKEELFFDDYVQFVREFIKKHKIKKVILVGHSFGGRVAIRFTALYPQYVTKLILTGASGIPHPLPSIKKKLAFIATKIVKPVFSIPPFSFFYSLLRKLVYYSIGEMDYYKAGKLSKTFKNVYQENILPDLVKIHVPTLLVWGENDTIIPVSDGIYMHDHIKKSKLVVVPTATHKLPYEYPSLFVKEIVDFLK